MLEIGYSLVIGWKNVKKKKNGLFYVDLCVYFFSKRNNVNEMIKEL